MDPHVQQAHDDYRKRVREAKLIALGGLLLAVVLVGALVYNWSREWRQVDGRIVETKIEKYTETTGGGAVPGAAHRNRTRSTSTKYRGVIGYGYTVDDVEHVDGFVTSGWGNRDQAQKELDEKYAIGKMVTVNYAPSDHADSTLVAHRGALSDLFFLPGIFLAFALPFAFVWWRSAKRSLAASTGAADDGRKRAEMRRKLLDRSGR